jgi:DNA mismatch repair protein MutS2
MLNDENLIQLELPAVLEKLLELISTKYGQVHFNSLKILYDKQTIERCLLEIDEMAGLLNSGYSVPIGELDDISPHLDKLKPENAFLETQELNQVKINLLAFQELKKFLSSFEKNYPCLDIYVRRIHPHQSLVEEIERVVDQQGEIKENASPQLRKIRNNIHQLEDEQKTVLIRVIKRYSDFSQDDIVTLRDGRMVLGIQQHFVNRVNGIVHGTSGSGATVFIEPMETLRISNQIQNLRISEKQEIIRLLKVLSSKIREVRQDIFFSIENYGFLDLIYAKARLSQLMQASSPKIIEKPEFRLVNARHPLLILKMKPSQVIPCHINLGEAFTTLVITGPNAGGKTVALKTIGLLSLMTQLGLHIPADPDSVIPIMKSVLVDIGDRQSLEQDLSTFSAHLLRLHEILINADTQTLVLIDEIGTGTDPKEGAALAIAILKELTKKRSLTVATTHHGELKAFAFGENGVENASMEFDLDTLQPTYKLQIGIPGSSYAFKIARRFGFSESVLKEAEKIVGPDKGQIENMILILNQHVQQIEKERRQLSIKLTEVNGINKMYQNQLETLRMEKSALIKKAAEEAQQIVQSASAKIEHSIAEIKRTQAQKDKIREAHTTVEHLKEKIKKTLQTSRRAEGPSDQLQQGEIVWVEDIREQAEIISEVDSNQKVWVRINDLKIKLDASHLKPQKNVNYVTPSINKNKNISLSDLKNGIRPELDLRGMDTYEAIEHTNRYLDLVIEEGWSEVRIIHGKGTGTLRKAIHQFLSKDKRIAGKRLGKWGEGDTGVTVVKLKE